MTEMGLKNKHFLSVRLLPSIFLAVASFIFTFCYTDLSYSSDAALLHSSWYFGVMAIFLLVDLGLELGYKQSNSRPYHVISILLAAFEAVVSGFALGIYFDDLGEGDASKRIIPVVLLVVLLIVNLLYRLMVYFGKWKTEEKKGNDLIAAYIGLSGLGNALLGSLSCSAILAYAGEAAYGYVGIFTYIALGAALFETLLGLAWLSFQKLRSSSKSNLFFYLSIFLFFASVAMVIVAAFAKSYDLISYQVALWCYLPGGAMSLLSGAGLAYLVYLGKK